MVVFVVCDGICSTLCTDGAISGVTMRLHHVGVVVAEIDGIGRRSAEQLGLRPLTRVFADPIQRVRVQFWGSDSSAASVELIEATGDDSPVARAAEKGGGLNHICYEVDDLATAAETAVTNGALCVLPPTPAVAFDGRPIAFFYIRGIGLVEYVQAPPR